MITRFRFNSCKTLFSSAFVLCLLICFSGQQTLAQQLRTRTLVTPEGNIKFTIHDGRYVVELANGHLTTTDSVKSAVDLVLDTTAMKFKGSKLPAVGFLSFYQKAKRSDIENVFKEIHTNRLYKSVGAVLIHPDGTEQGITNRISVKLKAGTTDNALRALLDNYKIKADSVIRNPRPDRADRFTIYLNKDNQKDAFDVVNRLNASKLFEYADVVWIRFQSLKGFAGQQQQWGIQNNSAVSGASPDADMKVLLAWGSATGKNIRIAVLDDGIDLNHPDLRGNLEPGHDATARYGDGSPDPGDSHGTNCAGIIAAMNNDIGVVGVAYNAHIIPVKIGYGDHLADTLTMVDDSVANAIYWAVHNGKADILSCSWNGGSPSGDIQEELQKAMKPTAGHRGVIVIFAAGNDSNPFLPFPANLPGVIAVGASSMCATRKTGSYDNAGRSCDGEIWGSNYGTGLMLLAPGVKIMTTGLSQGTGSPVVQEFSGTSAACPQVAGVVALMLEARSALTADQVTKILKHAVAKIGGYPYRADRTDPTATWCKDAGYGRIDALLAVNLAKHTTNNAPLMMIARPRLAARNQRARHN